MTKRLRGKALVKALNDALEAVSPYTDKQRAELVHAISQGEALADAISDAVDAIAKASQSPHKVHDVDEPIRLAKKIRDAHAAWIGTDPRKQRATRRKIVRLIVEATRPPPNGAVESVRKRFRMSWNDYMEHRAIAGLEDAVLHHVMNVPRAQIVAAIDALRRRRGRPAKGTAPLNARAAVNRVLESAGLDPFGAFQWKTELSAARAHMSVTRIDPKEWEAVLDK